MTVTPPVALGVIQLLGMGRREEGREREGGGRLPLQALSLSSSQRLFHCIDLEEKAYDVIGYGLAPASPAPSLLLGTCVVMGGKVHTGRLLSQCQRLAAPFASGPRLV